MANALPYGMTANMMAIVGVETLARKSGGHYGEYEANNDTSAFPGEVREVKNPDCICEKCGRKIIIAPGGHLRRFCDNCSEEKRFASDREKARRKYGIVQESKGYEVEIDSDGKRWLLLPCCKCGNITKKRKYTEKAICYKCKREKENAQQRLRRERRNALSEV